MPQRIERLEEYAALHPDLIFLRSNEESVTYREAMAEIKMLSATFSNGTYGNPILLLGKNSISWMLNLLSLIASGIPVVPLKWNASEDEIIKLVDALSAEAIIDLNRDQVRWIEQNKKVAMPSDVAVVFQTSGSTGEPKLVLRSIQSFESEGRRYRHGFNIGHQDCILAVLPLQHAFILGMALGCVLSFGCSIFVLTDFNARRVQKVLQKEIISVLPMIPSMARVLSRTFHKTRLQSEVLDKVIIGAGACNIELMAFVQDRLGLIPLLNYGCSETGVTLGSKGQLPQLTTTGRPLPGVRTVLRSESGREILWVKLDTPFLGYWENGKIGRNRVDNRGWYNTQDWAVQQKNGYIYIKGRLGSVFRRGGKFVSQTKILEAIQSHRDIEEVSLVGKRDHNGDDVIFATVRIGESSSISEASIRAYLKVYIDDIMIPQVWKWNITDQLLIKDG